MSVAASVAIQVLNFHTIAHVDQGAVLTSTEGVAVTASALLGLQNIALSGGLSTSGDAVGGAIVVNILEGIDTEAFIDSGASVTSVDAMKEISVTATAKLSALVPDNDLTKMVHFPAVTSLAIGASAGGGDAAVTGSFIVDVMSMTTKAYIAGGTLVNQSLGFVTAGADQKLSVLADDETQIVNVAGALAATTGSAGIGISVVVEIINKDVSAKIGDGAVIHAGGDVKVNATTVENLFELVVAGGASTSVGIGGAILVVVLNASGGATRAFVGTATLNGGSAVEVSSGDTTTLMMIAGNLAIGETAGVGASAAVLVRNGTVDAFIATGATITAGAGGVLVSATQSEDITIFAIGAAGGGDAGIAGSVVVDVLNDNTTAHIDDGAHVASGGKIAVAASDATSIKGLAGQLAIGGEAGVGLGADIEVPTKHTLAWIGKSVVATAVGDVTVDATSSETMLSISVGAGVGGTAGVSVNAAVSVIDVTTKAFIDIGASVNADGSVRVSADERLTLDIIAGNISVGGTAGVGAAAAVPIITKTTTAFIGDSAHVTW